MRDISIIIVNYNTRDLLRDCLQSISECTGDQSVEIVVIDNRSLDGSAEMVRAEFNQVRLIENDTNSGFASANNIALRDYDARYALLLNADTILPNTALQKALSFMDEHPEAGVMSAKLVRPDGSLDKACRRSFPTPWIAFARLSGLAKLFPKNPRFSGYNLDHLDPNALSEVDAVAGAFMMMRREAQRQAGLLDETFFAFGEDLDLCYRIKVEHGWTVYYYPEIEVLHYKGAAMKQRSYAMTVQFYRAMWIFHRKHYAKGTLFLFNWMIGLGIWTLCGAALLKNLLSPPERRKAGL